MKRQIQILFLVLSLLTTSLSANAQSFSPNSSSGSSLSSFRRNFATVMFCGLGGAVLGLSTLSFYGKPDEHIGNISTGFALGVIGGVAYATADTVQSVRKVESYSLHDNINGKRQQAVAHKDVVMVPILNSDF